MGPEEAPRPGPEWGPVRCAGRPPHTHGAGRRRMAGAQGGLGVAGRGAGRVPDDAQQDPGGGPPLRALGSGATDGAQAASCRGETSGTALPAGLGCGGVRLAAAGARCHRRGDHPPPPPTWSRGGASISRLASGLPSRNHLAWGPMSEGSTEEQAERVWGHPTGATAPSSRGTGEGTAGWRRQSLLGLKLWWEAEGGGSGVCPRGMGPVIVPTVWADGGRTTSRLTTI